MISFTLSRMVLLLHAEWVGQDRIIQTVSIDSKKITERCLFIALKGKQFDGHDFVYQAVYMGACALLVNRFFKLDIPQLIVKDTYIALAKLSAWVRQQVSLKMIAITGSSGKTSVKEMVASILINSGKVVASQKNFNNKIGVPLTLLRLTDKDNFGIIELGANNFGEIFWINSLVCPDVVLINNIFSSHLLGFRSLLGVAEAKGEIFSHLSIDGIFVLNADNNAWHLWKRLLSFRSVVRFSVDKKVGIDFFATSIVHYRDGVRFILNTPCGYSLVKLPMLGIHSVSNALAASALAFSVGARLKTIVFGLENMHALPGRLFPIVLRFGKLLLDDSYNANIGSILASIDVLKRMEGYRIIVVGDIAELEDFMVVDYHQKLGKLIAMTNINKVFSIGCFSYFISYFSGRGEHFYNKEMLVIRLMEFINKHEVVTILIKGSRSALMDQVVMILREQII